MNSTIHRRQRFIPIKMVKVILGLVKFHVSHEHVSLQEQTSGTISSVTINRAALHEEVCYNFICHNKPYRGT